MRGQIAVYTVVSFDFSFTRSFIRSCIANTYVCSAANREPESVVVVADFF